MFFVEKIRKIIFELSTIPPLIWSSGWSALFVIPSACLRCITALKNKTAKFLGTIGVPVFYNFFIAVQQSGNYIAVNRKLNGKSEVSVLSSSGLSPPDGIVDLVKVCLSV